MKLNYAQSSVTTEGSLERRQATVELNPVLLHVLSKDLYSRPIEAVIRELMMNAIDSHNVANQTRPVDLHLPYYWDETFYIRDYGTGLAHDWIMDHFFAFGYSDKRDTNELVGALGLGSKSPLAFVSSFMFTSFYDGVRNDYIVYTDEEGIPSIDHRESNPTVEPNGILVSFPVTRSGDVSSFSNAARKVLARIPPEKYQVVTENLEFAPDSVGSGELVGDVELKYGKGISIIMGYIAYDFDTKAVLEYVEQQYQDEGKLYNKLKYLLQHFALEVHADIGDFDIHPSRERINVTPRNIKVLSQKIEHMFGVLTSRTSSSLLVDTLLFKCDELPQELLELPVKARILYTRPYHYGRSMDIESQTRTYEDVLRRFAIAFNDGHGETKKVFTAPLSSADMVEYLGLGRREWEYNAIGSNQIYLFYDVGNTDPILHDRLSEAGQLIDLEEDIAKWKETLEDRKNAEAQRVHAPRRITRSISDPTHNVLIYARGDGTKKAHWESSKHNVQSLKALNRAVFTAPTRMGCVERLAHKELLQSYAALLKTIPVWKRPIILGLPASRGTKMIEAAFQPIDDLKEWMSEFIASDYVQRRAAFAWFNMYILNEEPYTHFGPVSWLIKCSKMARRNARYKDFVDDSLPFYTNLNRAVEHYKNEVVIKVPYALNPSSSYMHKSVDTDMMEKWIDTINTYNPNWRI